MTPNRNGAFTVLLVVILAGGCFFSGLSLILGNMTDEHGHVRLQPTKPMVIGFCLLAVGVIGAVYLGCTARF